MSHGTVDASSILRRPVLVLTDRSRIKKRKIAKSQILSPITFIQSSVEPGRGYRVVVDTDSNHYLGLGYYAALIAEARGFEVFPTADSMFCARPPLASAEGLDAIWSPFNRRRTPQCVDIAKCAAAGISDNVRSAPFQLLVLRKAVDSLPPSDKPTLQRLADIGRKMGVRVSIKTKAGYREIEQSDGLFLRCTNSYFYAIAAQMMGIPVIDDLHSILRCNNKAFVAEHLKNLHLPHPQTIFLDTESAGRGAAKAEEILGFPLVIKHPSKSHGRGVFKETSRHGIEQRLRQFSRVTRLALAQKFLPTRFDWRIGVLNNEALFACRYYMSPGYWKILHHQRDRTSEGMIEAVDLRDVPTEVKAVAISATKGIGEGLYGIDIKETESGPVITEINDNPDLNTRHELAAAGDEVWHLILSWFLNRSPNQQRTNASLTQGD